jgi:ABC-type multidrug transport system ATPase subunit/tellurite resistance protein
MSKALLEALMKIFAIVVNVDKVTEEERRKLQDALGNILNEKLVQYYMDFFDTEIARISQLKDWDQKQHIVELCGSLNTELTRHQKIAILLQLTAIMIADGEISAGELEVAGIIREQFKVEPKDYETLKQFVVGRSPGQLDNKDVLIIDDNNYDGRNIFHHITRNLTDGFLAILHIPYSGSYFCKNVGKNEILLNGMAMKADHIRPFAAGSSLRGKFEPIYYSDVVTKFKDDQSFDRLSLEVKHIGYQFKNGHIGLRDINFSENSGKLLGIMGASGAGKSTLLNVLNGTDRPTAGEVLVNGVNIHQSPEIIEGVIGFVPQDDLLLDELSVYQNLYYAAKLCFSQLDEVATNKLVTKTLTNLGLAEIKDLKVGSPLDKVISGGQRKRVNIALELLREPSILFVDEPTSGLSSRDSENIMDLLKELSLNGKIVFVVIHQPSSQIFKMFDKLLVLDTGGYQIYYGNPVESVTYFKEASKLVGSDEGECVYCGNVNPEQVFDIIEAKIVDEYGWVTKDRKVSPEQWAREYQKSAREVSLHITTDKPKSSLNKPTALNQLKIFGIRDIKSKLANRQYVLINLLEAPVLALILAFIVRYSSGEEYVFGSNENIPSYLFMSIIVALFMGLTVSAEEIIKDKKILKRESFLNLSKSSYLSSKLAILFGISALQTLMYVLIGNAILEIKGMYLIFWAILFTTSAFANLLGLNLSAAMNSVVTVYILIPFLLIPQLLLSGVVVKFDQLNKFLRNETAVPLIGDVMVSRWMLEAALVEQFTANKFEKIYYPYDKVIADTRYTSVYYIPALINKVKSAGAQLESGKVVQSAKYAADLQLLKTELNRQLAIVGPQQLPEVEQVTPASFNQATMVAVENFLGTLKRFNQRKQAKAITQKDSVTSRLIKQGAFERLKQTEYNEYIARTVTNTLSSRRILEHNGRLVRLIDPVFLTTLEPKHKLDYRAPLYVPVKRFLGLTMSTTFFNLLVVWLMTTFMVVALFRDWLPRLMNLTNKP